MIVVSGCPRSGTSLMMDCLRVVFGENRILGSQWPWIDRVNNFKKRGEQESEHLYSLRMYLSKKLNPELDASVSKSKDLNPNGFWECPFTVRGIFYQFGMSDMLEQLEAESNESQSICKIVSQGLANSDPNYIDKIIFMMRPPRAVAKSQERLKRVFFNDANGVPVDLSDEMKIQTPQMFINVTVAVTRWLLQYSDIPFLLVHFDDLVANPRESFSSIQSFIGSGDFEPAVKRINPKLKRSKPEDYPSELWQDAELVYNRFCAGEYEELLKDMSDGSRPVWRNEANWHCPRLGQQVNIKQCEACRTIETVRKNFRIQAESKMVKWLNEPCPYECGFGDGDSISIEDSIKNNFWSTNS